jgi:ATP-dependent Clp protease ATP-binding subunit ClpA
MLAFSQHLNQSLERAAAFAERLPEDVTAAHLLLALTDDPDAAPVMQACNVDLEQLRRAILASIPATDSAPLPDEKAPRFSQRLSSGSSTRIRSGTVGRAQRDQRR